MCTILGTTSSYADNITDPTGLIPYQFNQRPSNANQNNNDYFIINQSGELIHPAYQRFNHVKYYPLNKVWHATQVVNVPWQSAPVVIDNFYTDAGQVVEMDQDDLITKDLKEHPLLKFSSQENRYVLVDHNEKIIKKLDPRIIDVEPYSSQLARAKINISKYNDRYGYINLKGEWVIPPKYKEALPFDGKYTNVILNSNWELIDQKGHPLANVIPNASRMQLSDGYWLIYGTKRNTDKVINAKNEIIISDIQWNKRIHSNLFVLEKSINNEKTQYLFNTDTGDLTPYEGTFHSFGYSNSHEKSNSKHFWINLSLRNKSFYRLLDRSGKTLLEDDYHAVEGSFWDYGWVKPAEKNQYILIDATGKPMSQSYKDVKVKQYGDRFYTIASNDDERSDLISPSGKLIAYHEKVEKIDGLDCSPYRNFSVVYNANGKPILPQNPEKACLVGTQYKDIPEDKRTQYIQDYIQYQRDHYTYRYDNYSTPISGPATININNVATLKLPTDYLFMQENQTEESKKSEFNYCVGYIVPKDIKYQKWAMCVSVGNIGYVKASSLNKMANQDSHELESLILQSKLDNRYVTHTTHFNWLKTPTFNAEQQTLSWGYELTDQFKTSVPIAQLDANASLIKFGKSNIIWLTAKSAIDAKLINNKLDEWSARITFDHNQTYQDGASFKCNLLPNGDKTLAKISHYLPSENNCFNYPTELLLTGLNYLNKGKYSTFSESKITEFINSTLEPYRHKLEIKGIYW